MRDEVRAVFLKIPHVTSSSRWSRILSNEPVSPIEIARRGAHLRLLRLVSDSPPSPFILLKGLALAEVAYPVPAMRQSLDVDILVAPEGVGDWIAFLQDRGFILNGVPRPHALNQITFTHPLGALELHWSPVLPALRSPTFDDLFGTSQTIVLYDVKVQTLGRVQGAIHLALHFQQHLFDVSVLFDLILWLDGTQTTPEELLVQSKAWGATRVVEVALGVLDQLQLLQFQTHDPFMEAMVEVLVTMYLAGERIEEERRSAYLLHVMALMLTDDPIQSMLVRVLLGPHSFGTQCAEILTRIHLMPQKFTIGLT